MGKGILGGITAPTVRPEPKAAPAARPTDTSKEQGQAPVTEPVRPVATETPVPEKPADTAPAPVPAVQQATGAAVVLQPPEEKKVAGAVGRGVVTLPEPPREREAGGEPEGHKPHPRPATGAGKARQPKEGRPHTGRREVPGERKETRSAVDRRPPKLGVIPPPPQVDKAKTQPKTERFKPEKKIKERATDRFLPEWEEEGEKLKNKLVKRRKETSAQVLKPVERKPIQIGETITIKDLAEKMHVKAADLIKRLMMLGMLVTINQEIDAETATILTQEFGYEIEVKPEFDIESLLAEEPETDPAALKPRPPIVTVMGHVDHGKTSLLDAIRKTNVTATEAGGITQHIGAYQVEKNNRKITFIDTPGHEAFTAMRARGAKVTDVVVLVVAADDGVMPQTVEALNHARAANVPIVVALNKIDKPNANPDRVKKELADQGLVPEEWGGDTIVVPVSALKKQGIEDLLEMILLVADILELKANPDRPARGTIIESRLDKGRGPVATVLVQNGTLNVGDTLVAGQQFARVRAMIDDRGRRVSEAGPSTPVEVLGFSEVPEAGEAFVVVEERLARQIAQKRLAKKRGEEARARTKIALEDVYKRIQEGQIKELPLIVKADVQGSAEVLSKALERLGTDEVRVNLIHTGVGAITETDIMLASVSGAIIIGFNVRPDVNARKAQEHEKVDIRLYQVIYDAINDVKAALSGLLEPEYREVVTGRAEVRKVFHVSRLGTIAGCYVSEGKVNRDASVRVIRDGVVVHTGKISSLKRFKDDVREVAQGFECGLMIENYNDIQEGDELEFFVTEAVKRQLE
ncbi:translation initiation factor IF-2 [Thermodesulfitimonas sp.]